MPAEHVAGSGRDRRFQLPQFFTSLNGNRTAFFDAGKGPALIFVHGLAGNVTHWVNVAPHFVDRFRVIGLDLIGGGETDKPDTPYSIDLMVAQVLALMDRLGLRKATLIGHSLGGMVATRFATLHPERLDRIVLVNPAGLQPMPLPVRVAGHRLLRAGLLSRLLPRVWRTILANVFYNDNEYTQSFIHTVDTTMVNEDIHDIARLMDRLRFDLLDHNYAPLLPKLQTPTYVIWGEKDRLVPARWLRRASKRLPNVTCEEIPRCGHMPIIERPARVIAFLNSALSGT